MKFYMRIEGEGSSLEIDNNGIKANIAEPGFNSNIDVSWDDIFFATERVVSAVDPENRFVPKKITGFRANNFKSSSDKIILN